MKTLYLGRHAKSSWNDADKRDFDRTLNERGFRDAPFMGKKLKDKGIKPDIVISSPAVRALTTAQLICSVIEYPQDQIREEMSTYGASERAWLKVINSIDNRFNTAMCFGHNPGVSQIASYLAGETVDYPTSGITCIKFDIQDWNEVSADIGKLDFFMYPKQFADLDA